MTPGREGSRHVDACEPDGRVRLQLPDEIHVGGHHGIDHEVPPAGHGVAVKDDGLHALEWRAFLGLR